jgi:hypothetical protein
MRIALELDWDRCPDGYEIVDYGEADPNAPMISGVLTGKYVRPISDRREPVHRRIEDLGDALVLNLVRWMERAPMKFIREHGLFGYGLLCTSGLDEMPLDDIQAMRQHLHMLIQAKTEKWSAETVALMTNRGDARLGTLTPALTPQSDQGPLSLTLRVSNLYHFLRTEALLILTSEHRLMLCAHCSTPFLAGTCRGSAGKRLDAKTCSTRCRVAAHRARQAAQEIA